MWLISECEENFSKNHVIKKLNSLVTNEDYKWLKIFFMADINNEKDSISVVYNNYRWENLFRFFII